MRLERVIVRTSGSQIVDARPASTEAVGKCNPRAGEAVPQSQAILPRVTGDVKDTRDAGPFRCHIPRRVTAARSEPDGVGIWSVNGRRWERNIRGMLS